MYPYDSLFEIFEQITQHILFLGPSPRKRIQFLADLESSKRQLTEIPEIDIQQLLERCYISRFENVGSVDEYIELVIEEVNRLLDKYFCSDIKICLSQNKDHKIVIQDSKRNLDLDMCLSDNFNESIIHIIKLLIILSFVTLHQDRRRASLLVFDDIVTSIDNLYRSFLYRYIQNEFQNFQIVFLTHSTSFLTCVIIG